MSVGSRWCAATPAAGAAGLGRLMVAAVLLLSGACVMAATSPATAQVSRLQLIQTVDDAYGAVLATPGMLLAGRGSTLEVRSLDGATLLGQVALEATVRGLAASGSTVVVSELMGVTVVSTADPANPVIVRTFEPPFALDDDTLISGVSLNGHVAYVGLWSGGFWLLDTADGAPSLQCAVNGWPTYMQVKDGRLAGLELNSAYDEDLRVWGSLGAACPTEEWDTVNVPYVTNDVTLEGDRIFAAFIGENGGLSQYRWDPLDRARNGTFLSTFPVAGGGLNRLGLNGSNLFSVSGGGELLWLDVAHAANTQLRARIAYAGAPSQVVDIAASSTHVYVAGSDGLAVYAYTLSAITPSPTTPPPSPAASPTPLAAPTSAAPGPCCRMWLPFASP